MLVLQKTGVWPDSMREENKGTGKLAWVGRKARLKATMAHDQGSTREAGAYGWQEARVICQELSQRGKSDQSCLIPLPPVFV